MSEEMRIQWFPGHMAKTRRLIAENLKLVDIVAELLDSRIPYSSRNPVLAELAGAKPRILVMNKCDVSDPEANCQWRAWFRAQGLPVILTDSVTGTGLQSFGRSVRAVLSERLEALRQKGQGSRPVKIMVAGIPNVGKSSFINRLAGSRRTKVEDRPGVTRGKQWISLQGGIELLDTPGILWPRFDDENTGLMLAFTGAVRDDIIDIELLAAKLLERLAKKHFDMLSARYKIGMPDSQCESPGLTMLYELGRKRGFLISGGEVDLNRSARILLDEFRGGKLGRISLEWPQDENIKGTLK